MKIFYIMTNPDHSILLFDGICNLCNGLVQFTIKRDKKAMFKFAALQSEFGQHWLEKNELSKDELTSVVLIQGDQYFTKSTAVLSLLKKLGGAWGVFYGLIIIPRALRDLIYDTVAKSRYKLFGKQNACMIPTPELEAKFL